MKPQNPSNSLISEYSLQIDCYYKTQSFSDTGLGDIFQQLSLPQQMQRLF